MALKTTNYFNQSVLSDITATGKMLYNCFVGLYTNTGLSPNNNTILGTLTEPTFSGYDRVMVSFETSAQNAQGEITMNSNLIDFVGPSSGTGGETVTGFFITTSGSAPILLGCENFPVPIVLDNELNSALFSAQFKVSTLNDNGSCTIVN